MKHGRSREDDGKGIVRT